MVNLFEKSFNHLSRLKKKTIVVMFVIASIALCIWIMSRNTDKQLSYLKIQSISTPEQLHMDINHENQKLVPLGKMKGELNGQFDSFYVAIDNVGQLFINRNIQYDSTAYQKSERWENISRAELKHFEKEMHFIPLRSKGLKTK